MTLTLIAIAVLLLIAAACKGAGDRLQFKFGEGWTGGLNREFWDPQISWRNKWETDASGELVRPLTERFWLSSTALVAWTDGWHLLQAVQYNAIRLAAVLSAHLLFPALTGWHLAGLFAGLWLLQAGAFHLTYTVLLHPAVRGYGVVAAAQPTDLIGLWKIITFLPDVLKFVFGPERKERRRIKRRNKYLAELHEWQQAGAITWQTYAAAVRDYDTAGTEHKSGHGLDELYRRYPVVQAASVPPVIDLRGDSRIIGNPRVHYRRTALANKQKYVPHMSGSDLDDVFKIARFHTAPAAVAPNGLPLGKGWKQGIGYHEVTHPDGQRYRCWDYEVVSYHVGNTNWQCIGNCLTGDFNAHPPTPEQIDALVQSIVDYNAYRTADPQLSRCSIDYHDYLRPGWTTCPGKFFPREEVARRVAAYYAEPEPAPAPPVDSLPIDTVPVDTVPVVPDRPRPEKPNRTPDRREGGRSGCLPGWLVGRRHTPVQGLLRTFDGPAYDIQLPPMQIQPVALTAGQVIDWGNTYLGAAAFHERTKGEGAVVFILDTAGTFADHRDLAANNLTEFNRNFSNSPDADRHSHGTHCAGICGGVDNDYGIRGIAPGVGLVALKVLNDSGGGSYDWIALALRYAADLPDAGRLAGKRRILSLSLGGPPGLPTPDVLKAAIDYAIGKGCIVVVAAGNSGYTSGGVSTVGPPGNYLPVITVASTNRPGDLRSGFSSGGREVDLSAPGGDIYSCLSGNAYGLMSGTSMACPLVAGVIALIVSLRPDLNTQAKVAQFLSDHATDILTPGRDDESGAGVPLLDRYLAQAPPPAKQSPAVDPDVGLSDWTPLRAYGRYNPSGTLVRLRWEDDSETNPTAE